MFYDQGDSVSVGTNHVISPFFYFHVYYPPFIYIVA